MRPAPPQYMQGRTQALSRRKLAVLRLSVTLLSVDRMVLHASISLAAATTGVNCRNKSSLRDGGSSWVQEQELPCERSWLRLPARSRFAELHAGCDTSAAWYLPDGALQ